ncbi:unnamed protein product [Rotaria sp. Silwood1]|nr:unnamed protein product [Rotaria sp. Silwood1]CAF1642411.1 unnamed protein product [Rotaria sp. Silwood1]
MKSIKKVAKDLKLTQHQSSIFIIPTSSSEVLAPLTQVLAGSSTTTLTTSHNVSPVALDKAIQTSQRCLASQSQSAPSSKRSRT